jgi:nucleotide-binding universal stress UspA family protein
MTDTGRSSQGSIVVGVDGSPPSVSALRWAARLAPVVDGVIVAVTAWQFPITYGADPAMLGWGTGPGEAWRPDLDAEVVLERALESAFGASRPAGLVAQAREGQASAVLIAASEGAELLVVGSRGHGGFAGLLLGSVSSACAEHAKCPVLVVHDRG